MQIESFFFLRNRNFNLSTQKETGVKNYEIAVIYEPNVFRQNDIEKKARNKDFIAIPLKIHFNLGFHSTEWHFFFILSQFSVGNYCLHNTDCNKRSIRDDSTAKYLVPKIPSFTHTFRSNNRKQVLFHVNNCQNLNNSISMWNCCCVILLFCIITGKLKEKKITQTQSGKKKFRYLFACVPAPSQCQWESMFE